MPADVRYEDHIRLVKATAARVLRRVHAAGAKTVQFEDVEGELSVAWCLARDKFDASLNVPFVAYLRRGMWNHINRWVEGELREFQIAPFELDRDFGAPDANGDIEKTMHDVVCDPDHKSQDEITIQGNLRAFASKKLSHKARKFIELLDNPPQPVVDVLIAMQARAKFARARGITAVVAPKGVNGSFVMDILGYSRLERQEIYSELRTLVTEVNQQ
jgi:hypothetical protein